MKKEELMKLEGMTEELAVQIAEMSANEMKGMVPRLRLDEVIAERDNAKNDHAEVLKQLGALQKETGNVDELKQKITQLENDAKEAQKTHEAEITQLRIDNAVETALLGANALNTKAVKALLDMEGAELQEDGTIKGLADQITKLQESDGYLFGSSKTTVKGAKSGESGNDDGEKGVDTSKMTYTELAAYMAEHPEAIID